MRTVAWIFLAICCTGLPLNGAVAAHTNANLQLITDRSGGSECCGPGAIRWGFMCPIAARFHDHLYALTFTRTPDGPWDALTPIEAPVAFWSQRNGKWTSVVLDAPHRTY